LKILVHTQLQQYLHNLQVTFKCSSYQSSLSILNTPTTIEPLTIEMGPQKHVQRITCLGLQVLVGTPLQQNPHSLRVIPAGSAH
jgi:hypothetical protein